MKQLDKETICDEPEMGRQYNRPLTSTLKLAAVGVVLSLSLGAVHADELDPAPPINWNGAFYGVTVGGAQLDVSATDTGNGPTGHPWLATGAKGTDNTTGFVGGARAGYNLVLDRMLVGVEADISGANISQSKTVFEITGTSDINWLATLRGRAGYIFPGTGTDVLVYGTGGLALAGIEHSIGDTATAITPGLMGPNSSLETRTGYAVGGGLEVPIVSNMFLGVEYLYMDFGSTTVSGICVVCFGGGTPGTPYPFDIDDEIQTIRVNLTWKLGG